MNETDHVPPDLVIRGGRVIDPASGVDRVADVAVRGGRVVSVGTGAPTREAAEIVDASGMIVTPGLIDLHTHIFHRFTYWGIDPDSVGPRSGVTTWVDAGSAGAFTLGAFRHHVVEQTQLHIRALINLSSIGLVAPDFELRTPEYTDAELCIEISERHRDLLAGVKVRMGVPTTGDRGLEPLRLARQVSDATGLPIMVHLGDVPPDLTAILRLLRGGDVLTHCCTAGSMGLVEPSGHVRDGVREAIDEGVLLDVGHGAGGFSFQAAEALLTDGLVPHTISTDLHQMSIHGSGVVTNDAAASAYITLRPGAVPVFDLPACMNAFLALGLSLSEVIAATTSRPAQFLEEIGSRGTLQAGAHADIAIFDLHAGELDIVDPTGDTRRGHLQLIPVATFVAGHRLEAVPFVRAPWVVESSESSGAPARERSGGHA